MRATLVNIINGFFVNRTPNSNHSTANAYYSEASVQVKLGIELFKQLGVDPILEKWINGAYLDLFAGWRNKKYGIELKYKTISNGVPGFQYKNQGAQGIGKYDFIRDIERLERCKTSGIIDHGYAVLLTNDPSY